MAVAMAMAISTSASPARAATQAEARGKVFVEKNCAPCHATGSKGESKDKRAPPLRTLSQRYKLENLEEAFAEGITVSHNAAEMPAFELEPDTITDMLTYIRSISRKK